MRCFLLFVVLILFSTQTYAQATSEGTRFWMAYMENIDLQFNGEPSFGVWISSPTVVSGTISVPQTGLTIDFSDGPGAFEVSLPAAIWYSEDAEEIDNKGILIETDTPVNAAGIHYRTYFSDGTRLLPEGLLGDTYSILAAEDANGADPSAFVIVATEDGTSVTITPSALTTELSPQDIPFTIDLDAGQTFQVKSLGDLTGTTVEAANEKQIAIFAGANLAAVGCGGENSHLWDQLFPVAFGGKQYPLIPYDGLGTNDFKVLALEDDTEVTVDCENPILLNAGEFTVLSRDTPGLLRASSPVHVAHLNQSSDCNNTDFGPSFAILQPLIHQTTGQNLFCSSAVGPIVQFFSDHLLNLVASASDDINVIVNGSAVSFVPMEGTPQLQIAQLELFPGENTIVAPAGVWAQTASFGDFDACTYGLGFNVEVPLDNQVAITATGGPSSDLLCAGESIDFAYTSENLLSGISWDFDGLGTSILEEPSFVFSEPGSYTVTLTGFLGDCPIEEQFTLEVIDCGTSTEDIRQNPVSLEWNGRFLTFSRVTEGTLSVFQSEGKMVIQRRVNGQPLVELPTLSSGIYLAVFETGAVRSVLRFPVP